MKKRSLTLHYLASAVLAAGEIQDQKLRNENLRQVEDR